MIKPLKIGKYEVPYPLIQGGMGVRVSGGRLAGHVAKNGGVGLIAAAMVTRIMTSMLVGVSPTDGTTFIGIVLLFVAITVAASWLPARRASRLDPMNALREE